MKAVLQEVRNVAKNADRNEISAKLMSIYIVFSMLVLVFIGGTSIAETDTYTNDANDYSIQYPSGWEKTEGSLYGVPYVIFKGPQRDNLYLTIAIGVEDLPSAMTLDEYIAVAESQISSYMANYNLLESYSSTINGRPCNIRLFTATVQDVNVKEKQITFIVDMKAYILTCCASPSSFAQANTEYFEESINSFSIGGMQTQEPDVSIENVRIVTSEFTLDGYMSMNDRFNNKILSYEVVIYSKTDVFQNVRVVFRDPDGVRSDDFIIPIEVPRDAYWTARKIYKMDASINSFVVAMTKTNFEANKFVFPLALNTIKSGYYDVKIIADMNNELIETDWLENAFSVTNEKTPDVTSDITRIGFSYLNTGELDFYRVPHENIPLEDYSHLTIDVTPEYTMNSMYAILNIYNIDQTNPARKFGRPIFYDDSEGKINLIEDGIETFVSNRNPVLTNFQYEMVNHGNMWSFTTSEYIIPGASIVVTIYGTPSLEGAEFETNVLRLITHKKAGSTYIKNSCPTTLWVENELGQRIGYSGEQYINEIPHAYYIIDEDDKFISLPANHEYNIYVNGMGDGTYSLSVTEESDYNTKTFELTGVRVTTSTKDAIMIDRGFNGLKIGTEEDKSFKLDVYSRDCVEENRFAVSNRSISDDEYQLYSLDTWDDLKNQHNGITAQIDNGKDGTIDSTVVLANELAGGDVEGESGDGTSSGFPLMEYWPLFLILALFLIAAVLVTRKRTSPNAEEEESPDRQMASPGIPPERKEAINESGKMVRCSACNEEIPADIDYCEFCGESQFEFLCAKCKKQIPSDANMCPYCGSQEGEMVRR